MSRKLLKFLILFDNPSLLYFPGQFLTGRVLVELEDDTPVLGKCLNLYYTSTLIKYTCMLYAFKKSNKIPDVI